MLRLYLKKKKNLRLELSDLPTPDKLGIIGQKKLSEFEDNPICAI